MTDKAAPTGAVRLWDGPTRLVHWLIVAFFVLSWFTAETHRMQLHRISGYVVLGLVVFRIYWGFAGGSTARFGHFVRGPGATLGYARRLFDRGSPDLPGHNPLGAWSVLAILGGLLAHIGFGLFAVDVDGLESGPLSYMVSFETGRQAAAGHEWTWRIMLVLIVLHLAAVAFYALYKRRNLVGAMITGRRLMSGEVVEVRRVGAWRIFVGAALGALAAWLVAGGLQF